MIHVIAQDLCRLKTRLSPLNLYSAPKTYMYKYFIQERLCTDRLNSCTRFNYRPVRRKEVIVYTDSKVTKFMGMRGLASFKNEVKGKFYYK